MSRAYICDRCGKIEAIVDGSPVEMASIWLRNPLLEYDDARMGIPQVNLCSECYARFEDEYLANLKECS